MATQNRRRRGEAKNAIAIHGTVSPTSKAKLEKVAEALGASQSQILDWMIANTDVDAHGRPSWFTGPLPTDVDKELPLASVS